MIQIYSKPLFQLDTDGLERSKHHLIHLNSNYFQIETIKDLYITFVQYYMLETFDVQITHVEKETYINLSAN